MKTPRGLQPLLDDGVIDEVLHRLQSGKEAEIFVIRRGDTVCCAKVYKDVDHRGFHRLAEYQEGRRARGSRDARAMNRRSKRGSKVQESQWKNAEVSALYRLAEAGVRVPEPMGVFDGVLLMERIVDAEGDTAPQLGQVAMTAEQAREWHAFLIGEIVRMLCAGVIHGDLSEYNVLVDANGPVIIDLPQAVDAAGNNNAFRMLARDVNNLRSTFGRFAPELLASEYAREIWALYEAGELTPEAVLTGRFTVEEHDADVDAVLDQIEEARREAEARQRGREEAEGED
ncbi:PA4780 family RIO1-like protein kinase [Algiphilus aromaticivorans]|uniref:PA4780 family RIO1-like protein kinase n=1 Tax=Algiphilus aromaticivorans TaxID=382454 RepID=UPI0005C21AE4|nr:PA4780 family RIO1-like protein kinase [Algiphilus aromaticivorans]